MFTLQFETDNAAFDGGAATETAHILRQIAHRVEGGSFHESIHDINGNTIGGFSLNDK